MDTLNFIFRLGVVFAIFGFIWWIINAGISLLRGVAPKSQVETYILKLIRYFFLVDVTFLFCVYQEDGMINYPRLVVAGGVLLMYFLGKYQNAEVRNAFVQLQGRLMNRGGGETFNKKTEGIVILLSLGFFILFIIEPSFSQNPVSNWFYNSILNIEDTPIFGFVFKVVGFFFMVSILLKLVNGIQMLLGIPGRNNTGGPNHPNRSGLENRGDDDFDDYEEVE
ncbi:hypothetical protein [Lishizhenia sp.]|uniref:hypothetical protein n=1 Tax=Lishizhenia sp. TaxID=2497594 RepID=UPI00299F2F9E|nr:hypothetical protein [Lishizhenia sp.]MDX1444862.1 hypothetical protein [Lishizhenia sp.]